MRVTFTDIWEFQDFLPSGFDNIAAGPPPATGLADAGFRLAEALGGDLSLDDPELESRFPRKH